MNSSNQFQTFCFILWKGTCILFQYSFDSIKYKYYVEDIDNALFKDEGDKYNFYYKVNDSEEENSIEFLAPKSLKGK